MASSKIPIYKTIIADIKAKIRRGEITAEQPFPTQVELAKIYSTSLITSRRALTELVSDGFIYRVRGSGTYLKQESSRRNDTIGSIKTIYFVHNGIPVDAFNNRLWDDMFQGIKEVCESNGIDFFFWNSLELDRLPDDPSAAFIVLTLTEINLAIIANWKEAGKRLVTVHFYYPHLHIPYAIVDNFTGGYLATQHLLSLGHSRIGIILTGRSQLDLNQEFSLRLQGYRLALQQHQIEFDAELVNVQSVHDPVVEKGYNGLIQLMKSGAGPTAVFAATDYMAIGAIAAAKELGLRIPEDLSIIGYDDLHVGQYSNPQLTTVNQNTALVGKRAAEILLYDLSTDPSQFIKDEITPQLIVRASTCSIMNKPAALL